MQRTIGFDSVQVFALWQISPLCRIGTWDQQSLAVWLVQARTSAHTRLILVGSELAKKWKRAALLV
jgi:hypothetical protein